MSDRAAGFPDLRSFLDRLRRDGELAVIEAEVDPDQEAAEIHRRVIAAGGPALLFNRVRGADFPAVTNLFGTARRAELAFGAKPFQLIRRLVELPELLMGIGVLGIGPVGFGLLVGALALHQQVEVVQLGHRR